MKTRRLTCLLFVAIIMLVGCGGQPKQIPADVTPTEADTTPEPTLPPPSPGKTVVADGQLSSPYPSLALAFGGGASGQVLTIAVKAGDVVQAGDLLAVLDDTELQRAVEEAQVDLDQASINREQTIAQADVNVRLAQLDLADAREEASDAELAAAYAAVRDARIELEVAQHALSNTLNSTYDSTVRARKIEFDWYVSHYQKQKAKYESGHLSQSDHDHAMNAMISAEGRLNEAIEDARVEEIQAENRVDQARSNIYQAWEELESVRDQGGDVGAHLRDYFQSPSGETFNADAFLRVVTAIAVHDHNHRDYNARADRYTLRPRAIREAGIDTSGSRPARAITVRHMYQAVDLRLSSGHLAAVPFSLSCSEPGRLSSGALGDDASAVGDF